MWTINIGKGYMRITTFSQNYIVDPSQCNKARKNTYAGGSNL
jgi:hypothetical protein